MARLEAWLVFGAVDVAGDDSWNGVLVDLD
jgi:hypothetical protein